MICMFASNSVPSNFIVCDGRELAKKDYPQLFKVIGITYGESADKLKFKIPDLRGKFVRCVGGNAAALGVSQGDAIRNITGSFSGALESISNLESFYEFDGAFYIDRTKGVFGHGSGTDRDNAIYRFSASKVVPTANENRPINMSMNYAIQVN
ncbi:phage tail protein [Campylobacter sp. RM12637]|uniref:phage tail protein n=1 Tax=Campylobacter sp. RM12637 TaxID=2735734 RepID=UPI003014AACD|nr:tail fiber protein [Campylobacter sp. RM12637]